MRTRGYVGRKPKQEGQELKEKSFRACNETLTGTNGCTSSPTRIVRFERALGGLLKTGRLVRSDGHGRDSPVASDLVGVESRSV